MNEKLANSEILDMAKNICQDLNFPFEAALLEFIYTLEDYRINKLRPSSKLMKQWGSDTDGLINFSEHIETKTGRPWDYNRLKKLWRLFKEERVTKKRKVQREEIILNSLSNQGILVCNHCQKKIKKKEVEVDHVMAVSKGGSSEINNFQILCHNCNQRKKDKFWIIL